MSPYFSRLAQRSGVASTAMKVGHGNSSGNAAPDWSEQSVETTAPFNSLAPNTTNHTSSKAIENKSMQASDVSMPSATAPSESKLSMPLSTQQDRQKIERANLPAIFSSTANTLSQSPDLVEQDSSRFNETTSKSEPFAISAKHASVTFDHALAAKSSKESVTEDKVQKNTLSKAPTAATEYPSIKANSLKSTPDNVEFEIESNNNPDVQIPLLTRANTVQSRHADVNVAQVKSIASAPVQTPALSLQTARAAPRSSIQVHIGKIELEIFSPTTKPAATPKAVQMVAPRTAPAAAFNPHRHYLRSR
jgi:hypothetical protein